MNQPVVLRKGMSIAAITLLQTLLPALIVGGSLLVIAVIQDVRFDRLFVTLAVLAMTLSVAILRPGNNGSPALELRPTSMAMDVLARWIVVLTVLLVLGYIAGFSEHYARRVIIPWALLVPPMVLAVLIVLRIVMRKLVISQENLRTALIVGVTPPSLSLANSLATHPELCTQVLGFFDDRSADRLEPIGEFPMLGRLSDLSDYVKQHSVDVIFIALPIRNIKRVLDVLDELRDSTASLYYVPDIFVFDLIQSRTGDIMGIPVVAMCETPFQGYRGVVKRLTDLGLTLGLMIPALPLMLLIAVIVRLNSPGPVIFRQRRYGLDGKEIVVYKFRSMYVTQDGPHVPQACKGDPRITPVGRVLRRYSLDELPQLINVLQGKMSLVGPRPHAVAHNEQYRRLIKGYMIRHKVLPGITGLAQVNGCRGETTELHQMQSRLDYDLEYLRSWTPLLDLKILILTLVRVFHDSKAY